MTTKPHLQAATFSLSSRSLRVRRCCPECEQQFWEQVAELEPGVTSVRVRPPSYRGYCPRCLAARVAREFAELPWWRRTWARITGRRG